MTPRKAGILFKKLSEAIPNPTTELLFKNHFELLLAVIMSAQATDQSVNKVTPNLFAKYPTAKEIANAGEDQIFQEIKTIGLARTKSKNIVKTCSILVEKYAGEIPQTREELEALPGVGRKTANVILNTAFRQPVMAVDTHVFRVSNRTGLATGKTPLAIEKQLEKIIPRRWMVDAHHYLILHGRYTCKARRPQCWECQIHQQCEYVEKQEKS